MSAQWHAVTAGRQ